MRNKTTPNTTSTSGIPRSQPLTTALGAVAGAAWGSVDAYNMVRYTFQGDLDRAAQSSDAFMGKVLVGTLTGYTLGVLTEPFAQVYAPNAYNAINGRTLPTLVNQVGDPARGYYPNKNVGFKLDTKGRVLDGKWAADGEYKVVVKDSKVIFGKERYVPGTTDTYSHADLVNNESVNYAGTMKFKNGELQWYNEYSGHYQGSGNQWVLEKHFKDSGIDYLGKYKDWQ